MKLELYNAEDGFLTKSARLRSIRDAAQNGPQIMCKTSRASRLEGRPMGR